MNVLLVEDEDPKKDAVLAVIAREFPEIRTNIARSVRSAIASIRSTTPNLLLLDMSLPTFDISPGEPGGRPQGSGGIEIMRFLDMQDIALPTIVLTGYDAFSKTDGRRIGFEALREELARDFPDFFCGIIHFDSITGEWMDHFRLLVAKVVQEK